MFAAVVLICGVNIGPSPYLVDGCGIAFDKHVFANKAQCEESLLNFRANAQLPPNSFIADTQCVELSEKL